MLLTQNQVRFKHTFPVEQEMPSELFDEGPPWTFITESYLSLGIQNYLSDLNSHGAGDLNIVPWGCNAVSTHR
jgi:hypothetical protein